MLLKITYYTLSQCEKRVAVCQGRLAAIDDIGYCTSARLAE